MRALVLAAGEGRRMGGPKALVDWAGAPLAVAHARALSAAGATEVAVVVRAPVAEALAGWWGALPVTVVVSALPDDWGPAGSLRAAALALRTDGDVWAVTPVDALPARATTLAALVAALSSAHGAMAAGDGVWAARPVHHGRGGHPVVLDGAAFGVFRDAVPPPTLREVLAAMGDRAVRVAVDDAGITADLDTPGELARWLRGSVGG